VQKKAFHGEQRQVLRFNYGGINVEKKSRKLRGQMDQRNGVGNRAHPPLLVQNYSVYSTGAEGAAEIQKKSI